ncbi:cbb3-type cytochrome oxidase subunit 3 [Pseudomonas umsongensis]|jgi:cytochrome c oxidase cbb3-type subunit 4|uniref:CcoQ/FixQ family Cbb3-type cytochrome c oxidase assembly chaperone n=1 Tax=Pseudomonas umsongensis TaxID=198618 RepID=A0AAE7DDL0_9PSED|nr:CcoQ/FixQ family Cbb3-type cytochrome c oxidase assembly chaperone [Pseudomonas umsongensis]MCK8683692.1 CcoQ/FixQ family Cbb3-type cytochrome c oxidase assembly chaperone [Pseudomonas umsongensis]OXR33465.1 CcoQ/FixQ family Cbb3-type cytochrome c oxidase assembly chaperone [Pseudomonas umsongensis]QJC78493.1 CcoQ/FixQ family Cbb3-type cytochrome c oxidase assembly chaperone [Pseudomonas umsongensis]SDS59819.1 cytochrome c oxidase cbb3-type subunit 4 [Pseudomonas umsongensis]
MVVEMSTGMIRGLGTVVVFVAFVGLTLWVFNAKRSAQFAEARLLPFADEPQAQPPEESATRSTRP